MFCHKCGTKLPDEANFCSNCGISLKEGVARKTEIKWESCEINFKLVKNPFFGKREYKFVAEAIGPDGTYAVAESPIFKSGGSLDIEPNLSWDSDKEAYRALISQLLGDGWERTGQKVNPDISYTEIFRRQAN